MTNKVVHSCGEALRALSEVSDRIVVVAGPQGSALTTAVLDANSGYDCVIGSLIDPFDWDHIAGRPLPLVGPVSGLAPRAEDRTIVFDDADNASDRMLAHVARSAYDVPAIKIIFRTGLDVPVRLAQYSRITLAEIG